MWLISFFFKVKIVSHVCSVDKHYLRINQDHDNYGLLVYICGYYRVEDVNLDICFHESEHLESQRTLKETAGRPDVYNHIPF